MSHLAFFIVSSFLIASIKTDELPGNYTLPKNASNLCFIARFDMVLNVEYLKFDGKKNTTRIPLNNQTFRSYDGSCSTLSPKTHSLTLQMLDDLTTLEFDFDLNEKNQTSLSKVQLSLNIDAQSDFYFLNHSKSIQGLHIFLANESLFSTDRSNSYRCNSKTKIDNFKSKTNVTITSIDLENLRVQPFVDSQTIFSDYAIEKVCTMDYIHGSNLIPIIVGICLALLVVIVLVAYLIGRRRNRNGYQSV